MPVTQSPQPLGINPPIFQPLPPGSYFNRTPLPAPEIDTREASALAGKAQLYGAIGKILAELPDKMVKSYETGRKLGVGNQVTKSYNEAVRTGTGLENFASSSEGDIKYTPQNEEDNRLRLAAVEARANATRVLPQGEQRYNQQLGAFDHPEASVSNGGSSSNFGRVTDYGQQDDPTGDSASLGTGKYAFPTGMRDNRLTLDSMAISPDVAQKFRMSGIKPGDWVQLELADGTTVEKKWDDVTSDQLTGRFDFYHPDGPDPKRDVQVIGFKPLSSAISASTQGLAGLPYNMDLVPISGAEQPSTPAGLRLPAEMPAQRPVGNLGKEHLTPEQIANGVRPAMFSGTAEKVVKTYPGGAIEPVVDPRLVKQTATENAVDRAIIARGKNPTGMSDEEKSQFLKTEVPLKPSEKLSATRDLRQAYQALPSTTVLFGKGQMPGLDQIIEKIEGIKKVAGDDFSKMNPYQGKTIIFQFSKFNDPNSAVLTGEYKAAADTLSIPDKFWQVINKAATGESITPVQAKEIYTTVKDAYERAKENYKQDAADVIEEAKAYGISPRRVGIPGRAEEWMKETETSAPSRTDPDQPAATTANQSTQVQTKAQETLAKYKAGGYDSNPAKKAEVEATLRILKLL